MVDEPDKGQENQLTNMVVVPNKDIRKVRPAVLIPNKEGDGAALEERSESVTYPSQQNATTSKE
jgi:hypothetical protein